MPRTKEEIAVILTKRKTKDSFNVSTWSDLVDAIQALSTSQRSAFVLMLIRGETKKAGFELRKLLYRNAEARARAEIDIMLADDSLDLAEIDSIL